MKNLKYYFEKAEKEEFAIPQFNFSDFSQVKGNYIRITGEVLKDEKHTVDEFKEKLKVLLPKFIVNAIKYKSEKKARIESERSDQNSVLHEFIDKSETSLNKKKLLEVGLNLLKEVQS